SAAETRPLMPLPMTMASASSVISSSRPPVSPEGTSAPVYGVPGAATGAQSRILWPLRSSSGLPQPPRSCRGLQDDLACGCAGLQSPLGVDGLRQREHPVNVQLEPALVNPVQHLAGTAQ